MQKLSYYIIGVGTILVSLLIFSTICLYNQSQIINKQKEFINELTSKYYKFEEYEEAIKLADIIFDNNNIWDNNNSEIMNEYINVRSNIDSTFYEGFHNNVLLDSVIKLPKGSIRKLIGRKLTWEDEPVELKEELL